MAKAKNPENHPHAVRQPGSGRFVPAPATGKGHKEQTSAEHAAGIPSPNGPPALHPSSGPINAPKRSK
jgi:hypothetical protein